MSYEQADPGSMSKSRQGLKGLLKTPQMTIKNEVINSTKVSLVPDGANQSISNGNTIVTYERGKTSKIKLSLCCSSNSNKEVTLPKSSMNTLQLKQNNNATNPSTNLFDKRSKEFEVVSDPYFGNQSSLPLTTFYSRHNVQCKRHRRWRHQVLVSLAARKFDMINMIVLVLICTTLNDDIARVTQATATANASRKATFSSSQPSHYNNQDGQARNVILYNNDNNNNFNHHQHPQQQHLNRIESPGSSQCGDCSMSFANAIELGPVDANIGKNFQQRSQALKHQKFITNTISNKIQRPTRLHNGSYNEDNSHHGQRKTAPATLNQRSYANNSNSLSLIFANNQHHHHYSKNQVRQSAVGSSSTNTRQYYNYRRYTGTSSKSSSKSNGLGAYDHNNHKYFNSYDSTVRTPETILIIGHPLHPPIEAHSRKQIFKLDQNQDCPRTGRTVCEKVHPYPSDEIYKVVSTIKSSLNIGEIGLRLDSFFYDERENDAEPFFEKTKPVTQAKRLGSGFLVYETQVNYPHSAISIKDSETKHNSSNDNLGKQDYESISNIDDSQQLEPVNPPSQTTLNADESLLSASSESRTEPKANITKAKNEIIRHPELRVVVQSKKKSSNISVNDTAKSIRNISLIRHPRQSNAASNVDPDSISSSNLNQLQISPLCVVRSIYITPRAALNDKREWKYVVNTPEKDPQVRQIIKVDICEDPLGPCSDQVSLPFGFVSQCKQKYSKKKLLAVNGDNGQLEVDTFFIPSCCVCQLIRDTSISNDFSKKSS